MIYFSSNYKGQGLFFNEAIALVGHCTMATIKHLHYSSITFQLNLILNYDIVCFDNVL